MKFNTKTIHGKQHPDKTYGAVMTPIYQTSTYAQNIERINNDYQYSRSKNPTRTALENALASIEQGAFGIAFGSGLAAIDAVLKLLKPGDEVICTNDLYGGSYRLFTEVFKKFGIIFRFVDMKNTANIESYISKNTALIWVETPTNPLLNILDLASINKIAKTHGILFAVDNTFATPYLQQPISFGADIVMHSATKYLGGHSDIVLGGLVVNDQNLAEKLYFIQNASGAICGPQDAFLALRGIKTLHVRMQRHCENAKEIAEYLNKHPKIEYVYWPGFKTHQNHIIATQQMTNFGGMVSFTLKNNTSNAAKKFLKKLQLFTLAESLGGIESLAGHPASMTHASIPKKERETLGIVSSLIRLSVGIEDIEDLIYDLEQALT